MTDQPQPDNTPNPAPDAPGAPAPTPAPSAQVPGNEPTPAPAPTNNEPAKPAEGVVTDPVKPGDEAVKEYKVPDEYKDRPWASKIKSEADLFKQLDNLDKLAGKKGIPPDLGKATPEEREAFYAQLRPKEASEYVFTEGVAIDPDIETGVRDVLMKNGVSAVQGNEIIKAYQAIEQAKVAQMYDINEFSASMKASFGEGWETQVKQTNTMMKNLLGADGMKGIDALPNMMAAPIYRYLAALNKAFGATETNTAHLAPAGSPASVTVEEKRANLRAEINKLNMNPAFHSDRLAAARLELDATYKNDARRTDARR